MGYQRNKEITWFEYTSYPASAQSNPNAMMHKALEEEIQNVSADLEILNENAVNISSSLDNLNENFVQANIAIIRGINGTIDAIEKLGVFFDSKMSILIDTLSVTNDHLIHVSDTLDKILEVSLNPEQTKASEYRRVGISRLSRHLFDKALESFLKSLEINDTDFFVNLQIGKLYLYCNIEENNFINLEKAEKYLKDALRYGQAELTVPNIVNSKQYTEIKKIVSEIALHCYQLYLVKTNDLYFKENEILTDDVKKQYQKALDYAIISDNIYQTMEAKYSKAKANVLMGKSENAIKILLEILNADFKFIYRIRKDKDFDIIIELIENSLEKIDVKNKDNKFLYCIEMMKKNKINCAKNKALDIIVEDIFYSNKFIDETIFEPIRQYLINCTIIKALVVIKHDVLSFDKLINNVSVLKNKQIQRQIADLPLLAITEKLKPFPVIKLKLK